MEKKEYSYKDVLKDILNYFIVKEDIDVLEDTSILKEVCEEVKQGKRYSLNGYRLDFTTLMYALLENSLDMYELTKNRNSKKELDYTNIYDCNKQSKQFYDQDEIELYSKLLLDNELYFHTLVSQFIDTEIVKEVKERENILALKEIAKKSDSRKELEKEERRYRNLRNAVIETYKRHGNKATRDGFLYYIETGNAQSLSNSRIRTKLNSYNQLEVKTIIFDYIIREYCELDKKGVYPKKDFIEMIKKANVSIYQYEIPESWYIGYVNDMINGLYAEIDKKNTTYRELMKQVITSYLEEKKYNN